MSDEGDHYLSSFLKSRLPELGLDYETYGPYVTGAVEEDGEELLSEDILELLRASSESHSDDDEAWQRLQKEISKLHAAHTQDVLQSQQDALAQKKQQEHDMLQKEIELVKQKEQEAEQQQESEPKELDATKRALMECFAYDESEDYDHDGNLKTNNNNKAASNVSTNKQEAVKHTTEDARKTRQAHDTSKKTERIKTKEAKEAKKNLKEERRKRATKGERKR